jgi:hypothetical protein
MASSGTLAAGTTSYASSLATSGAVDVVTFPDRYGYVSVANVGTAGALYVTTDNVAPATSGDNVYAVQPGETQVFANQLPLWYPSSRVIPAGAIQFGGGNTTSSPSSPGEVQGQRSLAGQMANPGTIVQLTGAANAYVVGAAG